MHFTVKLFLIWSIFTSDSVYGQSGGFSEAQQIVTYQHELENWLNRIDTDLAKFNSFDAKLSWETETGNGNEKIAKQANAAVKARISWKNRICESEVKKEWLRNDQERKLYLLCRGPKFSEDTARKEFSILNKLKSYYQFEICLDKNESTPLDKLSLPNQNTSTYPKPGDCLMNEPDLERLIKRSDLNPEQLKWIWNTFYSVAKDMKNIFPDVVRMQNYVARENGYADMGEAWRDELEIPNLELTVLEMFSQIKPMYEMLHAVVRQKLLTKYGPLEIDPLGPIPIHLLGNMWGQDWSTIINLFLPLNGSVNFDTKLKAKNWTVTDMVLHAEDFYTSMGLMPMTKKFWKYSSFEKSQNSSTCHGTAANLFSDDDYRILLCAKINMEDFYVIHHEMGHIEYNMAYKYQPTVFQEGTNSAFHEAIGDVIMNGVMAPQHLYRLGLLTDEEIANVDINHFLLLQQALAKIPEIPFSLVVDKNRWDIFSGKIDVDNYNKAYWDMNLKFRGVVPPQYRSNMYFDAGAKFHVPDNTPYIRYFLSSILHMQIYKGLCELALYGHHPKHRPGEDILTIPLHTCDIYGCKKCGHVLEKTLSMGASIHWSTALEMLTGKNYITTAPLMEYYSPVFEWLKNYIKLYNIPTGWSYCGAYYTGCSVMNGAHDNWRILGLK